MSDDTERIKEKIDLADLIGEYVQLKQAGNSHKGLCPFHQEKTPSFVVTPDKGIWYCFGCSEGGDAFSFIQRIEGVGFPEALQTLAERAGVTLSQQPPAPGKGKRTTAYELMELAARFYHEILLNQSAGQRAVAYLKERGLTQQTMEEFMLGYAPQAWDTLQQYLLKKGYSLQQMSEVGLAGRNERGKAYDRFRGRIMFPVRDVQGRVVAFGGRIVPWHATGNEGKYINSPETDIYEKRRVVYNLERAKKHLHKQDPCLVVEGYMDVALLHQVGLPAVVASSGTAFTAEQVALLKRYTSTLHFAFDADAAGVKAAQAATQEAIAAGLRVGTIVLPPGQDPADIAQQGKAAAQDALSTPVSIITFLLQRLKDSAEAHDRDTVLAGILPFVATVANPVQQGEMVRDIAATLGVPEGAIIARLEATEPLVTPEPEPHAPAGASSAITLEHLVLGLMVQHPSVRETFFMDLTPDMFTHAEPQRLFAAVAALASRQRFTSLSADQLLGLLPAELATLAQSAGQLAEHEVAATGQSPEQVIQPLVERLRQQALKNRLVTLQQQLADGTATNRTELLRQFSATAAELADS